MLNLAWISSSYAQFVLCDTAVTATWWVTRLRIVFQPRCGSRRFRGMCNHALVVNLARGRRFPCNLSASASARVAHPPSITRTWTTVLDAPRFARRCCIARSSSKLAVTTCSNRPTTWHGTLQSRASVVAHWLLGKFEFQSCVKWSSTLLLYLNLYWVNAVARGCGRFQN